MSDLPRIATASLAGCFGCHMSVLDIDDRILKLAELVEFDRSPITDIKTVGDCDVGIIEGGVANAENVEVLRSFREHCTILVAMGACAVDGGIPAMRNSFALSECLEEAYLNCITSMPDECVVPYHEDLPKILDKVYACSDIVEIDHFIPGCPPNADHIWRSVLSLLSGQQLPISYAAFKYD